MLKAFSFTRGELGVEGMRKYAILLSASVLLILVIASSSVKADITSFNWINPLVKSEYDDFYGQSVSAGYQVGSTAELVVNVQNDLSVDMNISSVRVWFDWGTTYNSTEVSNTTVVSIPTGQSHLFNVTFQVPDLTSAGGNLVLHSYRINVDDVNATSGNLTVLFNNGPRFGTNFAIFSGDQGTVKGLEKQLAEYDISGATFMTAEAKQMLVLAQGYENAGVDAYMKGDFSGAVTNYQTALTYIQNAWGNETSMISGFETSFKDLVDSSKLMLSMIGWGYTLFGIGFFFMGIGVLVYLVRKSGTPKTPK